MKKFTADFETCTWLEDETYVWAWALCDIDNPDDIKLGTDIDSFFKLCQQYKNPRIYFHNLKFDGEFILYYLMKNGYVPVIIKKENRLKYYETLDKAHTTGDYTDFIKLVADAEDKMLDRYLGVL